jgi:ketosteroid isomerase-like protein
MSQTNVEIMRVALDAFARNDLSTFLRCMDPEVQFEPRLAAVEGLYTGFDGVKAFFADVWETLEVKGVDCSEVRDLGDQALALGSFRMGGTGSGVEANTAFAILARFRDGRIRRVKDYGDRDLALVAAGLSE